MKHKVPPVTSIYFATLMKAYLRGTKTREEVIQDLYGPSLLPQDAMDPDEDVTRILLQVARDTNEHYYDEIITAITHATDSAPSRAGLIHHLQALLAGELTRKQLLQWATWHSEPDTDTGAGYFDDLAVDYFCTHLLPNPPEEFTTAHFEQALKILQHGSQDPLKDKVALVLIFDKEKQRFLFYLGDFIQGHSTPEQLDVYLLNKFGMDHQSFPYMSTLSTIMHNPAKLPALLEVAAM
ncbi:hypothetical protein [Chitinophaga sp. MM2321]|uniref:hypothetical protein n=1 Tax=Chitinophaga sp. MM2321 TaxID=3137178 RepID=UPI0032D56966